ncbi:MAG: hypothetical protein ACREJO_09135 [Phycisphaerales bacterium]
MNPVPTGLYDWAFHVGGWAVGALAIGLLLWAMLRDRARGRLRCPKCWYDVASIAGASVDQADQPADRLLTCPECGYASTRIKRFARTRRRWRWVPIALVVGLGGWLLYQTPELNRAGWTSLIPTTGLVYLAPADDYAGSLPPPAPAVQMWSSSATWNSSLVMPAPPPATPTPPPPRTWREQMGDAAWERLSAGKMWRWQSTVFLDRHFAAVHDHPGDLLRVPSRWPAGSRVPVMVTPTRNGATYPLSTVRGSYNGTTLCLSRPAEAPGVPVLLDLELANEGGIVVWKGVVVVPCDIVTTPEECVRPVFDFETSNAVGKALALRLARIGPTITAVYDSDLSKPNWKDVDCLLGFRLDLVVDNRVVATGRGGVNQRAGMTTAWNEIELFWAPDEYERFNDASKRRHVKAAFHVSADVRTAIDTWAQAPFDDLFPRVWFGSLICPAYLQTHPSISPPMPPTDE